MGQQGFTLIEQIVTVAIMAMVLVAGLAALSTGALGLNITQSRNQAMTLAQEQQECIKALPFDPLKNYSDDCTFVPPSGYQVTTEVISTGDLPARFVGSDKIQIIKVKVLRGGTNILEIDDLKVNRP